MLHMSPYLVGAAGMQGKRDNREPVKVFLYEIIGNGMFAVKPFVGVVCHYLAVFFRAPDVGQDGA